MLATFAPLIHLLAQTWQLCRSTPWPPQQAIDPLQRALEAAGVEFTNGDQPGVRFTLAAAARSAKAAAASKPLAVAKAVRGLPANARKKKR